MAAFPLAIWLVEAKAAALISQLAIDVKGALMHPRPCGYSFVCFSGAACTARVSPSIGPYILRVSAKRAVCRTRILLFLIAIAISVPRFGPRTSILQVAFRSDNTLQIRADM